MGFEPTTVALKVQRSDQLSYVGSFTTEHQISPHLTKTHGDVCADYYISTSLCQTFNTDRIQNIEKFILRVRIPPCPKTRHTS